MAEAHISVDQFSVDQFSCPVCLDLLKDPVTINCGHSFCLGCINKCWDQEDQGGVYSCPQCRETFTPRPVLRRNNMLVEVVEKLKKTEAPLPDHFYAGPGDVECDFCTGRKYKAVKSCLMCLASFCETHLKPHLERPALKKHTITEASANLQDKICSHHDEVLKMYCRTDQSLICSFCTMDKHKGHDTVTAKAERTEKQSELQKSQNKFQQRIQEKQKTLQQLKQAVITLKHSAEAAVKDSEGIFAEMISILEKKRSEVSELIRRQERAEVSRAEDLLKELKREISDLEKRATEIETLSRTQDHIHFLQVMKAVRTTEGAVPPRLCKMSLKSFPDLCVSSGCENPPSITFNQYLLFDQIRESLSDLKERLKELCKKEFNKVFDQGAAVQMISPSEPKSREDFLKYFCKLTLDPNTANPHLILCKKNRVVKYSDAKQPYSDHPDRFDIYLQVLCKESVCGRSYWDVEMNEGSCVYISVSYKGIRRKGKSHECWFGHNNQSWSLHCSPSTHYFYHNNIKTELRVSSFSRIGVYVDHSAGSLSFYSISDTMRLLHRVQTTFTQPLYAGFWVYWKSIVKLCDP